MRPVSQLGRVGDVKQNLNKTMLVVSDVRNGVVVNIEQKYWRPQSGGYNTMCKVKGERKEKV